jgi:hypothetical protein
MSDEDEALIWFVIFEIPYIFIHNIHTELSES